MFTRILTDSEAIKFSELIGLKATKIFISKNNKYYYATIVDESLKIRISEDLVKLFI